MKIIVTAIALCFVVSVGGCVRPGVDAYSIMDAPCAPRAVSSDDESAAHAEFVFICRNGMKGRTKVYDDSVFSFGFAPVPAPFVGTNPRYRHRRVDITTSRVKNDLADVWYVDKMPPPVKDELECGFMAYRHVISSLVPPSPDDMHWYETNLTFITKGYYPGHRNEDDKCNDKKGVTGFYAGSYEHPTQLKMFYRSTHWFFDSLIGMQLKHLHGERGFIAWEEDWGNLIIPEASFPHINRPGIIPESLLIPDLEKWYDTFSADSDIPSWDYSDIYPDIFGYIPPSWYR